MPRLLSHLTTVVLLVFFCTEARSDQVVYHGSFSILWGDSFDENIGDRERYFLYSDNGRTTELLISPAVAAEAGGLLHLNGKRVAVTVGRSDSRRHHQQQYTVPVHRLDLLESGEGASRLAVVGPQPWVSIMCKFKDKNIEQKDLDYFQNMYVPFYPGLDHYWKEASYATVNITGSSAHGWYTLPQPRSYYIYEGRLDFDRITGDCLAQADADVYFPDFAGINLMFNDHLDGYAWGGSNYLTIDAQTKRYRVTWEPPWGFSNITVIAHEMGHGFGMPHSSGNYGQTYDNVWDVMSSSWANCGNNDHLIYGCLPQHTIGYHRDLVGWLSPEQIFTYDGNTGSIVLEPITLPGSSGYLLAKVPISGSKSHYYTVEVRQRVGYDTKLGTEAVIIHEVDEYRTNGRHAYVIDIDNNGYTGDAGAIWEVGETFSDMANSICIGVTDTTAGGYAVQIGCELTPPAPLPQGPFIPALYLLL
jgi:M6 family metalloprotease-like protein